VGCISAAPDLTSDVFGNVVGPMFERVEGDDPLRSVVLSRHQISDDGLEICLSGVSLAPRAPRSLEAVQNEIDVLIADSSAQ
jgi:hypothetical protein